MSNFGNVDNRELKEFVLNFERAQKEHADFFIWCARELAGRLLALVIPDTPVGEYTDGRIGGTLRRGWVSKTHYEAYATAGQGVSELEAKLWADSLKVDRSGNNFVVTVTNPVYYASYVEYGHRTRGGRGFVEGQYFLTFAENELKSIAPALLEKWIHEYIGARYGRKGGW